MSIISGQAQRAWERTCKVEALLRGGAASLDRQRGRFVNWESLSCLSHHADLRRVAPGAHDAFEPAGAHADPDQRAGSCLDMASDKSDQQGGWNEEELSQ